jgi:hypothetical protein
MLGVAGAAIVLVAALAGCSSSNNSTAADFHSPDKLPPASWRPFTADSPWNRRIPANPRIDPRSARYVKRLLGAGPVTPLRVGDADTRRDFAHAIYFADDSDPLYAIRGGSRIEPYRIDGEHVRLPAGARPAAGPDHHLAIVYHQNHWGCFDARVDRAARTIHCAAGRKVPLYGVGLHAADTAARFPSLAGRIRYQEIAAGRIDHAIFAASSQIAYTWVYPAGKSDGQKNARLGYPPMGTRFQLDPAYMTDKRLATYPPWKRAVLRAIRDYGFFLGDSTGKALKVFPIESGTDYTSFGLPDPWVRYARSHGIRGRLERATHREVYDFDMQSGVDWHRLRAIAPCVASKDC